MTKLEQLTKELQALIDNPDLSKIIEDKMWFAWDDGKNQAYRQQREYQKEYNRRLNASLTKEEKERMEDSHGWGFRDGDETDEYCFRCGLDLFVWMECPQYCEPREQILKDNQ